VAYRLTSGHISGSIGRTNDFRVDYKVLNSTLKCNSKIGCEKSGAAVGFVLFPPSKMRSTNETLQPAHAGTKIHNKYYA
jgi:hypothetical protein